MIWQRGWVVLGSAALVAGLTGGCGTTASDLHAGGPAPATSEAVVAVALSHLTPQPYSIEYREPGAPIDDVGTKDPSIGGLLRWKPDPDWTLDVQVQPAREGVAVCSERDCVELGAATLTWQDGGEDNPGTLSVWVVRDGELRSVDFEGIGIDGDPRATELPFDLNELEEIVTDPAFALETTTAAVEAGEQLARDGVEGSRVEPTALREPDPAPRTTPRALAAAVQEFLDGAGEPRLIRSGRADTFVEPGGAVEDGWGIALGLRHGLTLHVTVFGEAGDDITRCQPTLTCWPWDGTVHAGRDGLSGTFYSTDAHSVHVWLEGAGVDAITHEWFLEAERRDHIRWVQAMLSGLGAADGVGVETTPELVSAGEKLTWFQD
ncbi:hypothetical protein [Nocardioides cavernaquae]|uniref:hypothetical protein n=1 Tax=Nocardioides cavernaquae TaxID=2321396 RepID=UPI0011C443CC|nr:hypothetical protein [Nocardioides cavernaquae]